MLQNLDTLPENKRLVHHTARILLHAPKRQLPFLRRQEPGLRRTPRQVPERKRGERHRAQALDQEQVAPICQLPGGAIDLEDAEGEQAREGGGDGLGGVEEGEAAGELAAAIEGRLVVDDEGEEGGFGHAQEPADGHEAGEVFHGEHEDGEGAEGEHHQRQDAVGAVFFAGDGEEGRGEDVGDEEDGEDRRVLGSA